MEEYIEKAVTGFDGCNLLEGYYKNRSYFADLIDDKIWLYSNEPIASNSRFEDDSYITKLNMEELDDLVKSKMYAIYKGNEYEVQRVRPRLQRLELLARKGYENEDLKLGFEDDMYERLTYKLVSRDEIESIRVEKKSVYKEFLEKYTSK